VARARQGAEDVRGQIEAWLALPERIEAALARRETPGLMPASAPFPLWRRVFGIACVAGGGMALAQPMAAGWLLSAGVLALALGAGLLLRR
jgi:hypothetical protein